MTAPSTARPEDPLYLAVTGSTPPEQRSVLTPAALEFVARLAREFGPRIRERLQARRVRQARFDDGERPDFLAETRRIRESDWQAAPLPAVLDDRRGEVTGAGGRQMIINAMSSGANGFMADLQDPTSPPWQNLGSGPAQFIQPGRGA